VIWSISESRCFRRCQRQWFYKNCVASAKAKDEHRQRAYLLSKLQSISAWRGHIVDSVLSDTVIPALVARKGIGLKDATRRARELFDRQLRFAKSNSVLSLSLPLSKYGADFAALYPITYGGTLDEAELQNAWSEVEISLNNLFKGMDDLRALLKSADSLMPQRTLCFQHSDVTVRAVPDLIVFSRGNRTAIVDWKVHHFGVHEAWLQLGTYALALCHCAPHRDFPAAFRNGDPLTIDLIEVQLITGHVRSFRLTPDELDRIEAYIAGSSTEMQLAANLDEQELQPTDFPVAASPDSCQRCPYRMLCWEVGRED
jgi:hypothetical protein